MRVVAQVLRLAVAGVLAAGTMAAGSTVVRAQSIGQEAISYLNTFAFSQSLQTWDQAKLFNAEAVLDHSRFGFKPEGMMLPAGHMLFPSVTVKSLYDDNIFLDKNKVGDLRTVASTYTLFTSNLPRHQFQVEVDSEFDSFKEHSYLNYGNANLKGNFRIDIDAADTLGGSFQTEYGHHDDFLPIDPKNIAAPIPVWINRGALGYMHDAGRASLAVGADWQRTQYFNVPTYGGDIVDETIADNDKSGVFGTMNYRWSPGYRGFIAVRAEREVFPNESTQFANHNTYFAETGVVFEYDALLQFSLYGGYQSIQFDDPARANFGTATFNASLQWLPSQRMTVYLDAGRQMLEAYDRVNFAQVDDHIHGRLQYDIYHNIVGTLDLSLQQGSFVGSTRLDTIWNAGASVDYLFNENLALTLSYQHIQRTSNESKFDFDDNRFMASLKLSQ